MDAKNIIFMPHTISKIFIRFLKEHDAYKRYFKYANFQREYKSLDALIEETLLNPSRLIEYPHIFTTWILTEEGETYWRVLHMLWLNKLYQINFITIDQIEDDWCWHNFTPQNKNVENIVDKVLKNWNISTFL